MEEMPIKVASGNASSERSESNSMKSASISVQNSSWINKVEFIVSTKFFMIFLVLVGVILYIITQNALTAAVQQQVATGQAPVQTYSTGYKMFLEIIKLLSGTAISTGFLSLVLRISSMKSAITDVVINTYNSFKRDILRIDFNLEGYDYSTLDNLQKRIVLHKSQNKIMDTTMLNNSVYALERNLTKLTQNLFWEYHTRTTIIIPDKKNNIIKKKIMTEYKIVNLYELDNKVEFALSLLNGTDTSDENFKITHFKVNNEDLSTQIDTFKRIKKIGNTHYSPYSHELIFRRELQKCKDNIVSLSYEYNVPIFDLTHGYKLSKPCQKLNHTIILDGDEVSEWDLSVNAFSSWFYADSELQKDFQVLEPTSKNAQINFNYWSLPGAGYVVTLRRKC